MTNIDLLTATNDHIRKYPDLHNQGTYAEGVALPIEPGDYPSLLAPWEATEADLRAGAVCGTAFCFAGWAALLAGWHQTFDEEIVVDETGRTLHMGEAAAEALDIDRHMANVLFRGDNSLELIDRYVAHLVAHPDATRDDMLRVQYGYDVEEETVSAQQ